MTTRNIIAGAVTLVLALVGGMSLTIRNTGENMLVLTRAT